MGARTCLLIKGPPCLTGEFFDTVCPKALFDEATFYLNSFLVVLDRSRQCHSAVQKQYPPVSVQQIHPCQSIFPVEPWAVARHCGCIKRTMDLVGADWISIRINAIDISGAFAFKGLFDFGMHVCRHGNLWKVGGIRRHERKPIDELGLKIVPPHPRLRNGGIQFFTDQPDSVRVDEITEIIIIVICFIRV